VQGPRARTVGPMQHAVRDGVRLAFEEAGTGDPPIMLVHGMRCDHRHMRTLFDHLSATHRVVNVDLRGHGASDAPDSDYTNEELAGDLAWLADQLGMRRPVMIGHSFGGSLCLYLAADHPELVGGLVLLDSGVRSTAEKEAEMGAVIAAAARGNDPGKGQDFFADRLFGPDDDPVMKAEILAVMGTTPEHAAGKMGRTVLGFDAGTAAIECSVPSLFVLADRPFSTPAMIAALGSNWRVGQVVGAGHFVQVFAPAQVNAMVDRFLELLPPR
jgi:pimeloyl-ACP methyl ester carboxylesterase